MDAAQDVERQRREGAQELSLVPTAFQTVWVAAQAWGSAMLDIGISVGTLVIIPVANGLAEWVGWRHTYHAVGVASLGFVALWVLVASEHPEDCSFIEEKARLPLPAPSSTRTDRPAVVAWQELRFLKMHAGASVHRGLGSEDGGGDEPPEGLVRHARRVPKHAWRPVAPSAYIRCGACSGCRCGWRRTPGCGPSSARTWLSTSARTT